MPSDESVPSSDRFDDPRLANPALAEVAARVARARRLEIQHMPLEQSATILIPDEASEPADRPRRRTMKELLEERGSR